jgi:hypothetical protein
MMGPKMKFQVLATLVLGIAVLAVPAAVPASQPANVSLDTLADISVTMAPDPGHLATLLANPNSMDQLSIELVAGYTTLEWIDQDPFAL